MKNMFKTNILFILVIAISNVTFAEEVAAPASEPVTDAEIAYFFGYRFGNALIQGGNGNLTPEAVMKGLQDALQRAQPNLDENRQPAVIAEIQARGEAVRQQQIEQLKDMSEVYLAENRKNEGVLETASGLQYQILEEGSGKSPVATDQVTVHYEGRLINEQVFDSSLARGEPATFGLSQVIPGWTEGLQLIKEGGHVRFFIPPELGYGPGGTQNIPPHAVLVFDVQLIEIVNSEAKAN